MRRIMVVEDNPDNRVLIRLLLADAYHVTDYETGEQALAGMRRDRPDLVLLDISLPAMDGPEVVRVIRDDDALRDLPVIALTAYTMPEDRKRFLAAGFDDYLTKPIVDETVLFRTIERWLPSDQ